MDYYQFQFTTSAEKAEIIMALLSQYPFDTFEETATGLNAYIPAEHFSNELGETVYLLAHGYEARLIHKRIAYKNWNEEWESNFEPVQVEQFCGVRATFHAPFKNVKYEIIIDPKMAFGTGHHETTWMMMKMMRELRFRNAKVLDYGCGTGILSLLAGKMGATMIDAVDIDVLSYENTIENAQLNNVFSINAIHGDIKAVIDSNYNIILANINRHVILNSLPTLYEKLDPRGTLLISGILQSDKNLLLEHIKKYPFTIDEIIQKGEWLCLKLYK